MVRFFPMVEDLCLLKRTTSSKNPVNEAGDILDMNNIGKGHVVKTVELPFDCEEEHYCRFFYHCAAHEFDEKMGKICG